MLNFLRFTLLALALSAAGTPTFSARYTIASQTNPAGDFISLDQALKSGRIRGGDRLELMGGPHGRIELVGHRFAEPVLITPAPGMQAHADTIRVLNSAGLTFDGLQVWPRRDENDNAFLVYSEFGTDRIVFRNLDIRSTEQADAYPQWDRQDWLRWRKGGAQIRGNNSEFSDSHVTGISFGIESHGHDNRVTGNTISGFSGDAMRGIGDNNLFSNNHVQDCVNVDGNHDDGFQSWSLGPDGQPGTGTRRNLIIENNVILEWSGLAAPAFRCELQGIGLYDGMYENITIRNNVIVVTAWHGITGGGILNSEIIHNTLVHWGGPSREKPWIGVFSHKDGRPSQAVVVANNITPRLNISPRSRNVPQIKNAILPYPAREMNAPYSGDFTPKTGGQLHGNADPAFATGRDIYGQPRPKGNGAEIGAIEIE